MTRAKVTPPLGRVRQLPENAPAFNIVDFPRPYIAPAEMVECTQDWAAGYDPLTCPDEQLKQAVFDEIRDGLIIIGFGVSAALMLVAVLLWARG